MADVRLPIDGGVFWAYNGRVLVCRISMASAAIPKSSAVNPAFAPCALSVGMVAGLVASGRFHAEILAAYPYLEEEDIRQALVYAAWRVEEIELPRPVA